MLHNWFRRIIPQSLKKDLQCWVRDAARNPNQILAALYAETRRRVMSAISQSHVCHYEWAMQIRQRNSFAAVSVLLRCLEPQ
jgi:hypothetical protein